MSSRAAAWSAPPVVAGRRGDRETVALVLVAVLTVAAFVLRLSQIHQALFADELFTYDDLHGHSFGSVLRTVHTGGENSPPLYFLAAWLSAKLGDPAVWIRLPSLLLGTATVPALYLLGRQTVGRAAAVLGAAILAVGPFAVFYGVEARPYATMAFFVVVSTLALLRAVATGTWWWWLAYALAAAAAAYSHYTTVFVLAVQAAWSLWLFRDRLRVPLLANGLIALLYVPWLPHLRGKQLEVIGTLHPLSANTFVDDSSRALFGSPGVPIHRIPGDLWSIAFGVCVIAGAAVLLARWRGAPRRRPTPAWWQPALIVTLALATPVGLLLYSALVTDLFLPRGLMASLPAAALLVGALVTAPRGAWGVLGAAVVLGVYVAGTAQSFDQVNRRDPINDIARFINHRARPGAAVVYYSVGGLVRGRQPPFANDIKIYLRRRVSLVVLPSPQQLAGVWARYPQVFAVIPRVYGPLKLKPPAPPPAQGRPRLATARFVGVDTYLLAEYGPPAAARTP